MLAQFLYNGICTIFDKVDEVLIVLELIFGYSKNVMFIKDTWAACLKFRLLSLHPDLLHHNLCWGQSAEQAILTLGLQNLLLLNEAFECVLPLS